ncbi:GGDEF domain-containing protein [Dactylosporangium roseum]|uniref:GGDEF domain-containing protein n=1 Tax=Dactylosporangium roseum TaxID=47989 RepID=A0ABY5YXP6_9ACTN|nr:GGDEF domain-containing protein [Dactylosporangium roseum]UWZ34307.1 GGDEF domain-containing protein [Dactylosporangium roseum]
MSAQRLPEERPAFRAFTAVSAVIGVAVLVLSGMQSAREIDRPQVLQLQAAAIALTALVLAMAARSPLVMSGFRGEVTILLDTTVYVVVAHVVPFGVAVQCVAVGMIVACWTLSMNTMVRVAHLTAATAVWAGVITVKPFIEAWLSGFPQLLATALTLGILGEVGTLAVVAVTAYFSRGRNPLALFRASFGVEFLVGCAQGALACLTIAIIRDAPAAAALLVVPIGMLMVVSRALVRSQLANIRSSVLSDAVLHLQQCADPSEILQGTLDHAARMLRSRHVQFTDRPAGRGEIHAVVHRPDGTRLRLVAERRATNENFGAEDGRALAALAATASAALRTIDLIATMRWRAMHDALTQLPNRALFLERADEALTLRRADELVAILFVDLDGFKAVNDTLGHDVGDLLLQETARRLGEMVQAPNTIARLGGDEFVVLLRDVASRAVLDDVVDDICRRVAEPIVVAGGRASVGASIGTATAPHDGATTSALMQRADERMYNRKHSRRGTSATPQAVIS